MDNQEKFARYTVELERLRSNLVTILKSKGLEVDDEATLQELVPMVDDIVDGSQLERLLDGTLTEFVDNKITRINSSAFNGKQSLISVTCNKAETIGTDAFNGCNSLINVSLKKLHTLSDYAFRGATALNELSLPSVISLNGYGLMAVTSITHLYLQNLKEVTRLSLAYNNNNLSLLYLGSVSNFNFGVPSINLTTLIIGNEDEVCSLSSVNNIASQQIRNGNGYIYVPSALVDDYKVATNWSVFSEQIRAIEDYPEILDIVTLRRSEL